MLGLLLDLLNPLLSKVRRGTSVNINDRPTKEEIVEIASLYFSEYREPVLKALGETDGLLEVDLEWQDLLKLAQGNNPRKSYTKTLSALRKRLSELNVASLSHVSAKGVHGSTLSDMSSQEQLLIKTLEALVPFAAAGYKQGILDLGSHDRLSYRGTASEFREALRETLDHLAPDEEVKKQPNFKLEEKQTTPTMKQKVRFVLTSRGKNKTQREAAEKSVAVVESLVGEVARAVYNRASLATHVEANRVEVQRIKRYVDTILFDLLEISG